MIKLQQDLLYKKKNHSLLTSDEPATVRLGDEVLQLHPLDHKRDEPKTRPSIARIVQLMGETGDWKNLPGFLEGLKTARRSVKGFQMEKMVRRAGECGRLGIINDCLRRVEGTRLGLWDLRVAREVMWAAVGKCALSEWSQEGVERSTKFAENVWELMADPRHAENMTAETDPKRRPEILGVMILLQAARIVFFGEGKGDVASVERYVQLMLKFWNKSELEFEADDWNDTNYKMLMWAPVWRGMTMARTLLGPTSPLGKQLGTKISKELEPFMERSRAIVSANQPQPEGGRRRGLKMYEELVQVSS